MTEKDKAMDIYILLDRTGSMAPIWVEAVSSVNTYVKELNQDQAGDKVTLAVFDAYDHGMQFDVLRNAVRVDEWKPIGDDEVTPRGMTPLLDALVRIITRAEEVNNEKTVIVVMTDGYENASREVDYKAAKATLERIIKKEWQVDFLGANFDGIDQAEGLGVSRERAMNYKAGHADRAMASTAEKHRQYRHSRQAVDFAPEHRRNAGEDEVK
jgi:hypothetical protein